MNIDYQTRLLLDQKMKNLNENDENLSDFFEEVEREILRNMRDTMNRFLFSDEFKDLDIQISRNSEIFQAVENQEVELSSLN